MPIVFVVSGFVFEKALQSFQLDQRKGPGKRDAPKLQKHFKASVLGPNASVARANLEALH